MGSARRAERRDQGESRRRCRGGGLGLAGDEHGDTVNHGGPDKALLVFARHRYDDWRSVGLDLPDGGFLENLTLDVPGTDDDSVVLGRRGGSATSWSG
ncbi:hypothetical protein G7085_19665 [Tessaracoccus sp. HDW20]|nr:hypothetical protein [Tessaracoccus coleopterorum]